MARAKENGLKVKMARSLDGMVEGIVVPRKGECGDLPDDVARILLLGGFAEKCEEPVEKKSAPAAEVAAVAAPETAAAKRPAAKKD